MFHRNALTDFIREHQNWKDLLSKDPYNLIIKEDSDLPNIYLFKYNQYDSDMSLKICQEARGIILKIDNEVEILCHSFDKFFNYSEPNAQEVLDEFDWSDYSFQEKRDGSLLRMWWYQNVWHVSTSGTINAFKASIDIPSTPYKSFGDMFQKIFDSYNEDLSLLDPTCTYSFELTSPNNKIVVDYDEEELTFIGLRNNISNEEFKPRDFNPFKRIKTPHMWFYKDISEAVQAINEKSNFEGLVLCDKHFNRVKIKTDEYLELAHIVDATSSDRGILRLILEDKIDDLQITLPTIIKRVDRIKDYIQNEIKAINEFIDSIDYTLDRKSIALQIKDNPYSGFGFNKLKNPDFDVKSYFIVDNIEKIYKDYKEKSRIEDENESA